ncbi:MAG: CRISPR-associated endonuclease Cas3'', partial [Phycisphaerae bacterium]
MNAMEPLSGVDNQGNGRQLDCLLAKSSPQVLLATHCSEVGRMGQALLRSPCYRRVANQLAAAMATEGESAVLAWVGFLLAAHDVGKATPWFQLRLPDANARLAKAALPWVECGTEKAQHEFVSQVDLRIFLHAHHGWGRRAARDVSSAIGSHHGRRLAANRQWPDDGIWRAVRHRLLTRLWTEFDPPAWCPAQFEDSSAVGLLLSGLLILSDWLASTERFRNPRTGAIDPMAVLTDLGLDRTLPCSSVSFETVWPDLGTPRSVQATVGELCKRHPEPGLWIIEAPTGQGKTEAAIHRAVCWQHDLGLKGFYLALPTVATSNQMYDRVANWRRDFAQAEPTAVRLVHGMSWMIDDQTPEDAKAHEANNEIPEKHIWFRPSRRALLAPFAVGTVDQAMLAAMHVRFGVLRFLGLAASTLIIDEIHAYDAYMATILHRLLRWAGMLRIPVILLSATLPRQAKASLIEAYTISEPLPQELPDAYPAVTIAQLDHRPIVACVPESDPPPVCKISLHDGMLEDHDEIARLAIREAHRGQCVCV